ncbi:MAG: 4Fe-4S dicluster domain-containing protein [Planctomycetia bacterium]|nr:4Fe-4S dicluster domain-containing protein [Planctomycetia bacterium]
MKPQFLANAELQSLIDLLIVQGYQVVGPTLSQDAIVYDALQSVGELPRGWTDEQQPGHYRLKKREDDQYFGFVVGPHSWKKYLFPPSIKVGTAIRVQLGWKMETPEPVVQKLALLGMRACELAALAVQDRVFLHGPYVDPYYQAQRENLFLIAVNCTQAASTCFCTSMNTGPRCTSGFDLGLTELSDGFIVEVGTTLGETIAKQLHSYEATAEQLRQGEEARAQAERQISKQMDTDGIRDILLNNLNHPRWELVAQRCLSCANCTMVCPTCFCSTVSEVTDLQSEQVDRVRRWDSCFNTDLSYTNGGTVRKTIHDRYRQWMTHKLASWHDQFGTSGCVGCGRCITWCPVGIDITEEVTAIRKSISLPMLHVATGGNST